MIMTIITIAHDLQSLYSLSGIMIRMRRTKYTILKEWKGSVLRPITK